MPKQLSRNMGIGTTRVLYHADAQTVVVSPQRNTVSALTVGQTTEGGKMSVLIRNMEMPTNCHSCPMCLMRFCQAMDRELSERETRPNAKRPDDCPLVPADVIERKRGEWDKDSDMAFYWKCSECGAYLFWRHEEFMANGNPHFCPNCGSDMREKDGADKAK